MFGVDLVKVANPHTAFCQHTLRQHPECLWMIMTMAGQRGDAMRCSWSEVMGGEAGSRLDPFVRVEEYD